MSKEEHLANFALSISVDQLVRELGNRGLSPAGEPAVLRARLTQALYQEHGLQPIPLEIVEANQDQGAMATSSPLADTVPIMDSMETVQDRVSNLSLGAKSAALPGVVQGSDPRQRESHSGTEASTGRAVRRKILIRPRAVSAGPHRDSDLPPPPYEMVHPRATSSRIYPSSRHVSFSDDANFDSRQYRSQNSRLPLENTRNSRLPTSNSNLVNSNRISSNHGYLG